MEKIDIMEIVRFASTEDGRSVTEYADGSKKIQMNDEGVEMMKQQLTLFKEKFGREPKPTEPIFFDPDYDVPTPIDEKKMMKIFVQGMIQANTSKEHIYAYIKTDGLLPVDDGKGSLDMFHPDDLIAWENAIIEYMEDPIAAEELIKEYKM